VFLLAMRMRVACAVDHNTVWDIADADVIRKLAKVEAPDFQSGESGAGTCPDRVGRLAEREVADKWA